MIKKILVGIADAAYTASATHHALDLAAQCNASLTGISVLDSARIRTPGPLMSGTSSATTMLREETLKAAEDAVDSAADVFVRLCEAHKVPYALHKFSGNPSQTFIDHSRYHDLMVFGLRCLFEHGVLPEPHNELVKLVSAGVRPIIAAGPKYRPIHRVLVAYSGSVESARTMRRFTQLVSMWPELTIKIVGFGDANEEGPNALLDARDYMRAHGLSPDVEFSETTSPQTGLLQHAELWNADMIVLGNSAKTLLLRQMFGETALYTIQHSELPLFLAQ